MGSELLKNDSPFSGTNHRQLGDGLTPSGQTNDKNEIVENVMGGVEGTRNLGNIIKLIGVWQA